MTLKPFQEYGAAYLAGRTRALLADEPGVGKTPQLIEALNLLNNHEGTLSVDVICPAVAIEHWRREFRRWCRSNMRVRVFSYDQARSKAYAADTLDRVDVLIVDECHFAKNPAALRTNAVYGKGGHGYRANRIWAVSGSPAPNHAGELWPMMRAFGKTNKTFSEFVNYFCRTDSQGKIVGTKQDTVGELKQILSTFTLRRRKADVLPELGAIDIQDWFVEPRTDYIGVFVSGGCLDGSKTAQTAKEQEAALRSMVEGQPPETVLSILAGGGAQFATLRRYSAMLKAPAVFDAIKFEIENGLLDKVVIYGYHGEPMELLYHKFNDVPGIGAELIYGATPQAKRDVRVQRWSRKNGPKVMVASIIAAGVAVDFTAAHQVVMLEQDWVPGNNWQAMQRPHRHGQKFPVTVRVARGGPIDDIVDEVVTRKARELAELFE